VLGCVLSLLATGCDVLNAIARQQAQSDLASFRTATWLLVVVAALAVVARLVVRWMRTAVVVVLLACASVPVTLIACESALERPPSAVPYEAMYIALLLLTTWLAADAVAARRTRPRWRLALVGAWLASLAVTATAYFPSVGGPIVDAIAPGDATGCVRYQRGGWICWGLHDARRARAVDVPDAPRITFNGQICGLRDGRVSCSGSSIADALPAAPGPVSALALTYHEDVLAVANDTLLELADDDMETPGCNARRIGPVAALAVGEDRKRVTEHGCVLRPDRTVSCWRGGRFDDKELEGLALDPVAEPLRVGSIWVECPVVVKRAERDTKAIAVGDAHASALLDDGTLLTWGANDKGQLGRDADGPRDDTPRAVPGLRFSEIGAQGATTCGRTLDGGVFCWGDVAGTITRAPARVAGLAPAERLFFAHGCACALSNGALWCWMSGCLHPLRDITRLREIADEIPRPDPAAPRRLAL